MEAISGRKTIQEIAADHAIHPIQVSQWKRQLLDGASELFARGKKSKEKTDLGLDWNHSSRLLNTASSGSL